MEKILSEAYGCVILVRDGSYFIRYDSGESAGARLVENRITRDEADKASRSEQAAFEVILAAQARERAKPLAG
ncbi:MAG: hypothetical protein KF778_11225 [Rhodocyclaceae bacterium]|nr:hypothetical protein [Rhodocyclaceae bacterium]